MSRGGDKCQLVLWKSALLRRMLEIFHREVSQQRSEDTMCFVGTHDSQPINRAFSDWEDSLAFYERAFLEDSSHSLKQHGALYLARKHQYELAVTWIDEARGMTSRNNAAILIRTQ